MATKEIRSLQSLSDNQGLLFALQNQKRFVQTLKLVKTVNRFLGKVSQANWTFNSGFHPMHE